jgi:hypothetical protein
MRIRVCLSSFLPTAIVLCLGLALPMAALAAGGNSNAAAAPKPAPAAKPDVQQKKVWTNDDVERLNPAFDASAPRNNAAASAQPVAAVRSALPAPTAVAPSAPLNPEKDPAWYAQQLVPLQDELASIDSREEQLKQFRASGATLSTAGLVLNAPCEGITTDNLISQLEARRQEIAQEIDNLGDTARQNGLPPGILADPSRYAPAASQPTSAEERSSVVDQLRDATEELAQIQDTITDMGDQQAAQRMTLLLPVPGEGGNMTTDLLSRLDSHADALQGEISEAEDAAQALGVPPGDLR